MPRNFFLINIILFTIIGFLGIRLYNTYTRPLDVPVLEAKKQTKTEKKITAPVKKTILNESFYREIYEKDLFRPSRSPVAQDAQTPQTISPKEKPVLFGTTIMGDKKFAILEDPQTKSSKLYYINDSIAGFKVIDIVENKVILQKGANMIEIKLRDKKDIKLPKQPRKTPERIQRRRPRPRRTPSNNPETPKGNTVEQRGWGAK
jgi:hypothetical protein